MATKAACQTLGHTMKLVHFGALVAQAGQVVRAIGVFYIVQGGWLLLLP